jgi:hypothetical protein
MGDMIFGLCYWFSRQSGGWGSMVGCRGRLVAVSRDVEWCGTAEPRGMSFSRSIGIQSFGLAVRLRSRTLLLFRNSFGGFWDGASVGHVV